MAKESNKNLVFRLFRTLRAGNRPETVSALISHYKQDLDGIPPAELQALQAAWRAENPPVPAGERRALAGETLAVLDRAKDELTGSAKPIKGHDKADVVAVKAVPATGKAKTSPAARKKNAKAPAPSKSSTRPAPPAVPPAPTEFRPADKLAPDERPVAPTPIPPPSAASDEVADLKRKLAEAELELRVVREERDWLRQTLASAVTR